MNNCQVATFTCSVLQARKTSSRFYAKMFTVMTVAMLFSITSCESMTSWTQCTPVCLCKKDNNGYQHARCAVDQLPNEDLQKLPTKLQSLSIENSTLSRIPLSSFRGLESLEVLNLQNISIQTIDRGTLRTLDNLKVLDLRYNDIKTWRVFSSGILPSLEIIKMSGNKRWTPNDDLLLLQGLKEIQGVTWSEYCTECTLLKTVDKLQSNFTNNETIEEGSCHVTLDSFFLHHEVVQYKRAYEFVKLGFTPQCLCIPYDECTMHEIQYPYFIQLYYVPKRLFYIQYVLGFAVLFINLVIVLVVFSSKDLRCNASFLLICSMSISDVCVGVYTVGIAFFNPFKVSTVTPTELMDNDNTACPYLGFVFTTAQTTTVFTSLFLTVERYLAIIRCIRPRQKLELRYSVGISILIWMVSILFALLPNFGVKQLQYHKWFQCTLPFHQSSVIDDTSLITLVIVIGFVMVYVASVGLYLYIYFIFCKSTAHLAIRREARLAKRLSLVVGTNFVFFVVPTVLFLVYVYRFTEVLTDVGATFSSLQGFIIMGSWVPVTLLGISSLLNPFIYAFKHRKFRQEIGRICRRLDKYFGEVVTQEDINSPHHHHHHRHAHQAMMQERKKERKDSNEQRPHLMKRLDMES